MANATASPRVDRTIRLRDGRQLAYCEWGDLDGRPVALLHGQPGSRLFCPDEDATEAAGTRLLTIDRPGYGRSDPRPGRALLDWPSDYIELADTLDLPPCPVIGWSGGGKYALALSVRAPDRVTAIGLAASPGPRDLVPGALDELSPHDRDVVALLAVDRPAGLEVIGEDSAWYRGDGWEAMFAESWGEADDRLLARPEVLEPVRAWLSEGARLGTAGLEADEAASLTPWGFSLTDVGQPTYVWCAGSDVQVGQAHADYLAATIPRARLISFPGEGHLFPISHWAEMLAVLH